MRSASKKKKTIEKGFNEQVAAQKLSEVMDRPTPLSTRTLRRWRQAGVLPFYRNGPWVWYTDELLEKFLKQSVRNLAA